MGVAAVAVLRHAVAGGGDGLAEQDLPHVGGDVPSPVDGFRDARSAGRKLAVAFGSVAVELDVREMDGPAVGRVHSRQRGIHVSGHAQVGCVHVQRVRYAQLVQRARQRSENGARRDAVVGRGLVHVQLAGVELECRDPARIDHLDPQRLSGVQGPRDVVADHRGIRFAGEQAQQKIVVAQQRIRALVDDGRVAHLHVRLTRVGRKHRRLEAGRVAHLRVAVACAEGGRRCMPAP